MLRDNATHFESWNRKDADVRHAPDGNDAWDGEFSSLNDEWSTHQTLSELESMLRSSDPKIRELAQNVIRQKAGSAEAFKKHNAARVEALKNQVGQPKAKKGWNSTEINATVRQLWSGRK